MPSYLNEYNEALERTGRMAEMVAIGIAVTLNEIEKDAGTIEECGRVWQAADEICVSTDWNNLDFTTIISWNLDCLREERTGIRS